MKKDEIKSGLSMIFALMTPMIISALALGIISAYMSMVGVSLPLVLSFVLGGALLTIYFFTNDYFVNKAFNLEEDNKVVDFLTEEVEEEIEENIKEEKKVVKNKEKVNSKSNSIDYDQIVKNKFEVVSAECSYIENNRAREYTKKYINTLHKYYESKKSSVDELNRLKLIKEVLSNLSIVSNSITDFIYTETLESVGPVKKL